MKISKIQPLNRENNQILMHSKKLHKKLLMRLLEFLFKVPELQIRPFENLHKVLLIRQHNQFGDMIASVSIFRAIKETYPDCILTVMASNENYVGIEKNEFIDELFVFDKTKILKPSHLFNLLRTLRQNYDVSFLPCTISVSFTSCLFTALSKARIKVGPSSLNGRLNDYAFMFNHRLILDWRKSPDSHVSAFILETVKPFGISTTDYKSSITIGTGDENTAHDFLNSIGYMKNDHLIGFHIGAGKPMNRWPLDNFICLIENLDKSYCCKFYLTGSFRDQIELDYVKMNLKIPVGYYVNKTIPQFAALISLTVLFITNDTGVMHIAGATDTPQISIFGPTNPYNWAPVGPNKIFIRNSESIEDVTVNEVFKLCRNLLDEKNR